MANIWNRIDEDTKVELVTSIQKDLCSQLVKRGYRIDEVDPAKMSIEETKNGVVYLYEGKPVLKVTFAERGPNQGMLEVAIPQEYS